MPLSRRSLTALASLALTITGTHAQEQTARLLRDINREPGPYYANIEWIMPAGKGAVFPRYTPEHGIELWTTNGSPIGTRLLKDFVPGQQGSTPTNPVAFGEGVSSRVAFNLSSNSEDGLWITDGTENGTTRVFQNETGVSNTFVHAVAGTTAGVFFEAYVPFTLPNGLTWERPELLFSDGTAAGTRSLNSIRDESEPPIFDSTSYITTGQWCYFIANSDEEIWRSDGTAAGTQLLHKLPDVEFQDIAVIGERLIIPVGIDGEIELWTSSLAGGELTRTALPEEARWESIYQVQAAGDKLFLEVEGELEFELWVSDGTTAGTRRLPIGTTPGEEWYFDDYIRSWDGALYFQLQRNNLWELWRSDGTPEGTIVLTTSPTNRINFVFFDRATSGDYFYFWVQEKDDRFTLWRTRGTPASTRPVKGVPPTAPYAGISPLAQTKSGETFYIAAQGTAAEGVWKLRGNNGGARSITRPVKSTGTGIAPTPPNALPYEMLGGDLLAFVNTGTDHELWRMKPDGRRAKSIWLSPPLRTDSSSIGFHGTNSRGAIFSIDDGLGLRQVWITDGTSAGTRLLGNHGTDTNGGYPNDFVKIGDHWIYSSPRGPGAIGTPSLWITDGTPEGTSKVLAADGTAPKPTYASMIAFENGVAFTATGPMGEPELWRSDGTPAGTIRLIDGWESIAGDKAMNLSVVGGKLHFVVETASQVLWESDGTTAGTTIVNPYTSFANSGTYKIFDLGGAAIFPGIRNSPNRRWWRHDATGVFELQDYTVGNHLPLLSAYSRKQALAGSQLFYGGIKDSEVELWVTDGTTAGTRQVADLNKAIWPYGSSSPDEMLAVGNVIYFSARDQAHGTELWRSDGTTAGTTLVADINPGTTDSNPQGLKVMGNKLYFTADRLDTGRELFSIDLPQ